MGKNREKGWRGVGWKGGTEGPIISKLKTRVDAHVMGNQYLKTLCRYHMAIHNSAMVGIKPESTSDSQSKKTNVLTTNRGHNCTQINFNVCILCTYMKLILDMDDVAGQPHVSAISMFNIIRQYIN